MVKMGKWILMYDVMKTFGSDHVIATGIYGNDSTITFTVDGQGQDQWVSFYHQSKWDQCSTYLATTYLHRVARY